MDGIRGVPRTPRGSRKNRSKSLGSLGVRKGLSAMFHSRSPVPRRSNGDGAGPSSSSGRRSRSGSPPDLEILPSAPSNFLRQRSNTAPDLQILSSTSIRRPSGSRPFPYIEGTIGQSEDPRFLRIIEIFKGLHYEPGLSEMTSRDFYTLKTNLLNMAAQNDRKCNEGDKESRKKAGNQCALAVKEFQKISRNWRGPCEHVFLGWCQNWGTAGWKCSFFFKTSPSYNLPMPGYSYKMHDCINALAPEEMEQIENALSDGFIV
nr:PREDICTED: uncharacterized protein LOC109033647 [Bemisia tabaci]